MGSQDSKKLPMSAKEKLVSVNTAELKARLNRLYSVGKRGRRTELGHFDYLWDLKELALMEGRQSVDVPETWLDEIDAALKQPDARHGH